MHIFDDLKKRKQIFMLSKERIKWRYKKIISKTFDTEKSIDSIRFYDFFRKSDKWQIYSFLSTKGNDGNFSRLSNRDFVLCFVCELIGLACNWKKKLLLIHRKGKNQHWKTIGLNWELLILATCNQFEYLLDFTNFLSKNNVVNL